MATHPTSRERLVEAASDLFYRNGIHQTGVEAVAGHAGLTKPTLYNLFVSKESLVDAVLEKWVGDGKAWLGSQMGGIEDPIERLETLVDLHARALGAEGFRGCALLAAAQEMPGATGARAAARDYKKWTRGRIEAAAREAGLREPRTFAWLFFLLIEGAACNAQVMGGRSIAARLKKLARDLIDLHTPDRS